MIKNNNTLIGLLLISIIVFYYTYTRSAINKDDLIAIEANLLEKPCIHESGGDMPYYFIRLYVYNSNKSYDLISCGYDMCKRDSILALASGTLLTLKVKKEHYQNRKKNIPVFALESGEKDYLKLDNYNYCYTRKWRMMLPSIGIILLTLVIKIIYQFIRHQPSRR